METRLYKYESGYIFHLIENLDILPDKNFHELSEKEKVEFYLNGYSSEWSLVSMSVTDRLSPWYDVVWRNKEY